MRKTAMQIQSITGWNDHVQSGYQYLEAAKRGVSRPAVFNNELIFQLAAMGIEKIVAGLCQYHHRMPYDHTLSGLVTELAGVYPIDPELIEQINQIERNDDMCTLDPEKRTPPSDPDVREVLAAGQAVVRFARRTIPTDNQQSTAA
jgi:hypothetical protein